MKKQKVIYIASFLLAIGAMKSANAQQHETVNDSVTNAKFVEEMRKPWKEYNVYRGQAREFGPKPTVPPRKIEVDTNFIKEMRKPWQEYNVSWSIPQPQVDTIRRSLRNRTK